MSLMCRCVCLCAASSLTLLGTAALAGRPLVTEDADVLDSQACEWESVGIRQRASGDPSSRSWATQLGCGFGFNSQAALFVGRSSFAGSNAHSLGLGGKTALWPREDEGLGLTIAWGLAGAKRSGEKLEHDLSFINFVATKGLGPDWTAHANLGWTHSKWGVGSTTSWNLALEWSRDTGLDWMGEIYGDDRAKPWLGLGARWAASEAWSLNASWATRREAQRVHLISLGARFSF